ncbi:CshA/CshB family fibrillar adhesin-related protein, partial [uncultured Streptococcus sp.]|uniref:CshA/CshB family fibrillar adhesin-related protein n=1 Tax=uncultured Streptococcus sp. TaxID=83427 RepID=UPI0028D2F376
MFKLQKTKKDHRFFCGNKYEKYSIKKLKVGAASVLVGTGFLFGYNLDQVEANEVKTESVTNQIPDGSSNLPDKVENASTTNIEETNKTNEEPKRNEAIAAEKVASNDTVAKSDQNKDGVTKDSAQQTNTAKEEVAKTTSPQSVENKNEAPKSATSESHEGKHEVTNAPVNQSNGNKEVRETSAKTEETSAVNVSVLREKLAGLESQVERIHGNQNQLSHIQNAEKLLAEAKKFLESAATSQTEVDAKAKEISSLTNILKSIKAEEVSKENKNQDSRNGKKMEEGTGFRTGTEAPTSTTTGVGADVVDATETPAVKRPPYTDRKVAEGLAKQIAWLDFSDTRNWSNVDIVNGNVYLKEGSIYEKEIMPNYRIKLKVKSLKPFQATEIYRKRMEANNATPEEKATFNPNATNGFIGRWDNNAGVRVTAQAQDRWSEIKDNGVNTNGRKTSITGERVGANIGIQFEISGTYKGNPVRPAVAMADAESANPGEMITFTTNGSGWQQIIDLEKNTTGTHRYKPVDYYTTAYRRLPDVQLGNDISDNRIYDAGSGNKIAPKFFTNPDQETGGLGTGVFGPGVTAGKYSVPVVMTKNATEVGMYVFSDGAQAAMIGVVPIDEGDAPETYGEATHTMNTRDGLTGAVVKQPYLGSERPDADTDTSKNWHGDDDTDTADEGINQLLPDSLKGSEGNIIKANVSSSGYYTLNIQAHTGGADRAYVRSWLDFNNNGQFDADEASDIVEITQDGDVQLHFVNKTQKDAEGLLAAGTRVRIATSREEIEKPTGLAFSGEVEDFNAKITHPPKGDKQTTIGNAIIGNKVEKQSATVHFTPKGKYIYTQDDVNAEIDTTVKPVYINNKTGDKVTLSDENTYTVRGQGTYKFTPNGKDVDVEFTPAKGFVGKAHGFTIRRQDTNKTTTNWGTSDEAVAPNVNDVLNTMDGLYIPEVIMPTVEPTPNNAESRNIQGFAQKGKPTFNVVTSDTPVTASAKHPARLIDPRTNTLADSAIVDALDPNNNKVGTYKIAPETGEVTFTPNIDYKGEVQPVRVSVPVVVAHDKDDNDVTVTKEATYTPRIIPVAPTAEASTTRDVQGKAQVSRIVFDTVEENADKNQTVNFDRSPEAGTAGEHVDLDKETLTLVNASGVETNTVTTDQGEYVLDKVSNTITFTPKKEFVGTATAVNIRIKDMNGTKVETTYTPTVIEVTPTGKDSATLGPQGLTQKSPIVFNQREEEDGKTLNFDTGHERVALKPETLTLLNGSDKVKSITVPNVGTYELVDNAITFTPAPAYHGTAEGVNVQVADENGNVVTKKYVPTVTELAVTPGDKTTKNIQGETQEGTPTFTIPAESTNATVTSRKLVDPADQTEKDSVTVAGKGTFTIDGNGKVTFTPVPTYKDDVPPITVKATVTVTNAKNESTTITSTASYKPIIVAAEIDKAPATSTNLQGLVQTGTPTFTPKTIDVDGVQKTISVESNSYKLVKDGVESESLPAYKAGTSEQIGTYTINPATGQVTFTPTDKTYTGAVEPVSVQATGSNGVKVQTTYTPSITPVTPTKEPSETTDVQGKKQVSRIVLDTVETDADKDQTVNFNKGSETGANGERVELDASTLTLLDGTNEVTSLTTSDGKYELDKANKTITFTPNKNFVGPATPVKVQIKDVNGTKVETTYTPTVTDVTMTSVDKESSAPQGKTQTGTPTFTVSTPEVRITGYKLLNPTGNTPVEGNEIEVPDQGTYRINPTTGEVTFIPKPGFTGPATGITVQATDENGETKDAKYKPTVTALTITPQPVTTTNIQGETQEGTPTFPVPAESNNVTVTSRKLVDPADQTEKDSVKVEGKGTFTIDGNGKVTFTPLPTYKGDVDPITVKATVTITNDKNESTTIPSTTTYKPIIVSAEIDKEPATSRNLQGFVQTGTPAFKSKTVDVDGTPKTITVQPNSYKLVKDGTETNTLPAYKAGTTDQIGTYTIDSATGQVTFTPSDKTYSGEVAPVSVQATGSNGVKVETTYTPIITPVTPTAEASATSDVQGKKQTSSILLDTPENSVDKDKTVNFNKGSQVGANGERVELDASTLTLLDGTNEVTSLTTNDGEYVLDKASKTITFTPKKTFVGTATAVRVQIKDANGTKVETTYTPTVTDITMKGDPATTSAPQGQTQTGTPTFTISSPEVRITGYKLLNPNGNTPVEGNEIEVPDQGTYRINPANGQVTFIPKPGFTGPATGISVQATDENGETAEAKYTPTVNALTVTPGDKTTTNIQGVTQEETPTFTIPTESNNATVTSRKLVDPADQTEKDSVTVAGKGTFTIDGNGKVTFTPEPTFKGEVDPITVKATVTVTNAKNESATITSTATYKPVIVPAEIDKAPATSTNLQGLVQTGTPTFTPKTVEVNGMPKTISVEPNSYKLVKDGVASDSLPAYKAGTTEQIGTYTINPQNGTVTFTPTDKTYTGAVEPATVQATGSNGVKVQTTYTPTITPVTPTKEPSATTDVQGKKQVSTIVLDTVETGADKDKTVNFNKGSETGANGERVNLNPDTLTLLNDAGDEVSTLTTTDGEYVLDKASKTITFTPNKTFVGPAKPVKVQIKDANGTKVETTYTPTVTDVTMSSVDKTSEAPQGKTQTGTPEFSVSSPSVRITEYKLVDPTNNTPVDEVEVENQGTYSIDKATGEVTFVPKPGFTGPTTGIKVRATDENGETKDATYTPSVTPLKVTPENKTTTNIQGLPQEATPTFKLPKGVTNAVVTERKLIDPSTKALTNSVTVDGKGTFTINANGKVTFTPVPSYVGDVPAIEVQGTITVLNDNNDSTTITSKASYKPIIVPIELEKTPAESTDVQGLVQKGTPTFTSQSVDVNGVEKTVTVKPNSYKLVKDGTETDTIPAYKKDTQEVIGKYTIDPQTGEVTFTPTDKTYTGEVEPATVQATGSNNVKVQTTYTPIIKPVKPVGTNAGSEGIQGAPQSGTPTFKSGNENIPMTVSATNPAKLVDPTTNQPIEATEIDAKNAAGEKVGLYTINPATGEVTFTPEPGFSGTPVPATVQAKDGNGTPTTATYTPVVKAAVPSGDNQVTSDIQGAKQTATPVFTPGKNTVNNQEVSVPFEATSKAKLIDPSKTGDEREVTTLVVENQGTYTIDDNGVVTFTPLPTFKGEATPVSIERKDKNGTVATATFKPSVVGVTPSATEATTTKVQGATQETPVTFTPGKATIGTTEKSVPMDPASYKLLGGQEGKTPLDTVPAMSEDGTKEVGTYTIKVVDGKPVVTFTPTDKTYAGKLKPVTVQGKDTNGTEATTTYTPVITPIVPTAENGTSEGPQGVEQIGSVTFKPGKEPGTENTPVAIDKTKMTLLGTDGNPVESLTVSKDGKEIGTYTLVKDPSGLPTGEVKFTPTDKSYVGEVPAVTVQVKDANGTPATATYTPTFTEVNPTSKPSETTGFQGLPQTSRVVLDEKDEADNTTVNFDKGNDKVALVPSTLTLVNADGAKVTSVTVPNEGTYELNNGVITFTPLPTFHGKASGVSVQAEDVNGKVAKTTYTPTVTEVRPVGTNAGSEGIQGAPQSGTPTFKSGNENIPMTVSATNPAKLVDPTTNQPIEATEIDAKNAAGEKVGLYTINPATGEVTFTPEPGFSGTPVPATVQAKDGNGTPTTATYTPVVKAAVPSGDNQVTSDIQGAKQTATPVFTPGKNTVNNQEVSVPFEATSKAKLIDPSKTGDEREVTTLVVENQGTYTIDDNGVVTFTP